MLRVNRGPRCIGAFLLMLALAGQASAGGVGLRQVTELPIPTANSDPQGITTGPFGSIWFTEFQADRIGLVTGDGEIKEFVIPTHPSGPGSITMGPDGNLWFTEYYANAIGRITVEGLIKNFRYPPR